jgi:hypothetical protein
LGGDNFAPIVKRRSRESVMNALRPSRFTRQRASDSVERYKWALVVAGSLLLAAKGNQRRYGRHRYADTAEMLTGFSSHFFVLSSAEPSALPPSFCRTIESRTP